MKDSWFVNFPIRLSQLASCKFVAMLSIRKISSWNGDQQIQNVWRVEIFESLFLRPAKIKVLADPIFFPNLLRSLVEKGKKVIFVILKPICKFVLIFRFIFMFRLISYPIDAKFYSKNNPLIKYLFFWNLQREPTAIHNCW